MGEECCMKNVEREACVYKAKLGEQAERYDEMAAAMKMLVDWARDKKQPLTVEERNLLSVAYKNSVGSRRASWRIISSVEQKEKAKGNEEQARVACEYRLKVEAELSAICQEILDLLNLTMIPLAVDGECKVFYSKMVGDYYRYISEFTSGETKSVAAKKADESYGCATEVAEEQLVSTHPIRLGLALNYSVFKFEILGKPEKACEHAKAAFDGAIAEFDTVSEESYKDSTLIMQLLRDNLTLWTSDIQVDVNEEGAAGPPPPVATKQPDCAC